MGAVGGDRDHVVELQQALARDVQGDPVREGKPVPEARVDRVLEVGVAVDEPRDDHAAGEALAAAELGRGPDAGDRAVVGDRYGPVRNRVALDGDDPVRRDDPHRASASAAERSQRRSMNTESQIDASKSTNSGTTSSTSETGSIVGSRIANVSIST